MAKKTKKFMSKVKIVPQGQINCRWEVTFDDGTQETYRSIDQEAPKDRNDVRVNTYDPVFSDILLNLWLDIDPDAEEIGKAGLYTAHSEELRKLGPVTVPETTANFVVGGMYTAESRLATDSGFAEEFAVLRLKEISKQKLTFEVLSVEYGAERHELVTNFVEGKEWIAPNNPAYLKAYKVQPLKIDA